ncbi:hypothetical protein ACVWYN_003272 [Pedobacter sp. UYP24]
MSKTKDFKNIISIDEAFEIFKCNGLIFNRDQVWEILEFMDKIAKLVVEEYIFDEKER